MAKGYHTTKWNGMSNYECDSCPFSSLREDEIKEHVAFHGTDDQPEMNPQPDKSEVAPPPTAKQ